MIEMMLMELQRR